MKTKSWLQSCEGAGLALLLALLFPLPFLNAQETVDNVVVLLDASGSMSDRMPGSGQNKMDAAKAALKEMVRQVKPDTHIGILVFSASNLTDDWIYPLGPRDDARLMQAISKPLPGSSTPLGAYMKRAADRLLQERAKQRGYGTFRLLVVTDGEAQDQNLVNRYTPEIIARGITVDVIGVAMNQKHTLATKVHSYRPANDLNALKTAVAAVFAEVGGGKNDTDVAATFDLLQPLPNEVGSAMILALCTSGNQPIGEQPRATAPKTVAVPSPAPPKVAPSTPKVVVPVSQPPPPAASTKRIAVGIAFAMFAFGAILFVTIVLVFLKLTRR